jgi:hypothetical protein
MADRADRPGHIVEISDALGRDVDKAKEGKLKKALPIEAFMSQGALDELATRQKAKDTPVRADSLRAISPAEAQRRRTFGGEGLPDLPQVRRVIPAPFQRPSATIAERHGKTWRTLFARQIVAGDTVPDVGVVSVVKSEVVHQPRGVVLGYELRQPHQYAEKRWYDMGSPILGDEHNAQLDEEVAVGLAVVVFGAEQVKAFREDDEVQVFRNHEEQ